MTTIDVNGATIYYEEHGAGEPLVLLHGGLISSASWEPELPYLTGEFRVITPDTRGHGRSTNPSGKLTYPQLADDVAALIGELGLDRPIVGGYSDGGQIALELGVRHPEARGRSIVAAAHPDVERSRDASRPPPRSWGATTRTRPTSSTSRRSWVTSRK